MRHKRLVALGAHKRLLASVAAAVHHQIGFIIRRKFASIASVLLLVIAFVSMKISRLHNLAYLNAFLFIFIFIILFLLRLKFLLHVDHNHGWWNGKGAHLTNFLYNIESITNQSYPNLRKLTE